MQSILVYVLIALAAFYMGYRAYKTLRHKPDGGCEHCSPGEKKIMHGK